MRDSTDFLLKEELLTHQRNVLLLLLDLIVFYLFVKYVGYHPDLNANNTLFFSLVLGRSLE